MGPQKLPVDVKHTRPFPAGLVEILLRNTERIVVEEWGGPKSPMALAFLRESFLPEAVRCLEINQQVLTNPTFAEIFTNKLNTQFAYPPSFAEGLAKEILSMAAREAARLHPVQFVDHPWEPWERAFRLLTIGEIIPAIARKTGFSEDYIELLRRRYIKYAEIAARWPGLPVDRLLEVADLAEFGEPLVRFMHDFAGRFQHRQHYTEYLVAEQVVFEDDLPVSPGELLLVLETAQNFEGRMEVKDFVRLLAGTRPMGRHEPLPAFCFGQGLLSHLALTDIQRIVGALVAQRLLQQGAEPVPRLYLTSRGAKLVAELVVERVTAEVLGILKNSGQHRVERSLAVLARLNHEVLLRCIEELVGKGNPEVLRPLQKLPLAKNKQLHLKVLWACGQLGSPHALDLLVPALQNRDGLIRAKACEALGQLRDKTAYFVLVRCLDDPINLVKEHALLALAELGVGGAVTHVERVLAEADDYHVRSVAREVRERLLRANQKRGKAK